LEPNLLVSFQMRENSLTVLNERLWFRMDEALACASLGASVAAAVSEFALHTMCDTLSRRGRRISLSTAQRAISAELTRVGLCATHLNASNRGLRSSHTR
jgi:hypothetical protein